MIGNPAWLAMIVAHAAAGVGAFGIGIASLRPHVVERHRWLPAAVLWATIALVAFMAGALVLHWSELEPGARIAFSGLGALGAYMVHRARRAATIATSELGVRWHRYVDDVGFVLISLFNGFVIVAALDLGAPGWAVAIGAVAAAVVGHLLVVRHKANTA